MICSKARSPASFTGMHRKLPTGDITVAIAQELLVIPLCQPVLRPVQYSLLDSELAISSLGLEA
jgi:hypothetical protein